MRVPDLDFRFATLSDVELLAAFGAAAFRDAFGAQNDPKDIEIYVAEHFTPSRIRSEIEDPLSTFLLATVETRLVGYARLYAGEAPPAVKGPQPIELVRIYIDREFIRQGYGSALMQACLNLARSKSFRTIWLGVWEHNSRALHFYYRWGFRIVGTQQFILGNDIQQDFILERTLTPAKSG